MWGFFSDAVVENQQFDGGQGSSAGHNPKCVAKPSTVDTSGCSSSSRPSVESSKSKKTSKSHVQLKTVQKWAAEENMKPWLKYDMETVADGVSVVVKTIWCSYCRKHSKSRDSSNFVKGTANVKREAVIKHLKSNKHRQSESAWHVAKKLERNERTPILDGIVKMEQATEQRMVKLFRTAYYLAVCEKPMSDFAGLVRLQNANGGDLGNSYMNDKAAHAFISHIAGVYFDELKADLEAADFFSVMIDGSTDRADIERELIFIRFIKDGYPKMAYLRVEALRHATADGVMDALNEAFSLFGFDAATWKQKLVGFGADGAAVNMGRTHSVSTMLRQAAPWIVVIHCTAHRLELAIKDTFKDTYFNNVVIETLTTIYYFYRNSPKRFRELKAVASWMEEHVTKPARANGTRWIEHKIQAVRKMIANYASIHAHLSTFAETAGNPPADKAKARGILNKISQYKFVATLYWVPDVLDEIAKVSLLMQRNDVTVPSLLRKLNTVQQQLNHLATHPGPSCRLLDQAIGDNGDYKGVQLLNRRGINPAQEQALCVAAILPLLERRFQSCTEDIFTACKIFDPLNWPDDRADLIEYGNAEIQVTIFPHFQFLLANTEPATDVQTILQQWLELKIMVRDEDRWQGHHPLSIFQTLYRHNREREDISLTAILTVIHLTMLYPLSTAVVERGFSIMKQIKTDWRCNLSNDTMDNLMRIKHQGTEVTDEFDPAKAINRWWLAGQRMRRPNIQAYGPRAGQDSSSDSDWKMIAPGLINEFHSLIRFILTVSSLWFPSNCDWRSMHYVISVNLWNIHHCNE